MDPTLHESDYLIISKIGASIARAQRPPDYIPKRGEIIVFKYPKDPQLVFVKRVIGLPGERVVVKDGEVRIYNQEHPKGFDPDTGYSLSSDVTLDDFDDTVPAGNVFVIGDNRTHHGSFDSRHWGFLPTENIVGKAVLRLLPIDGFKIFSDTPQK